MMLRERGSVIATSLYLQLVTGSGTCSRFIDWQQADVTPAFKKCEKCDAAPDAALQQRQLLNELKVQKAPGPTA